MHSTIKLSATDYAALTQARRDMEEIGRMRTSTEIFGRNTRSRDRMLGSLRRMEASGLVRRSGHAWSTGMLTLAGERLLRDVAPPQVKRLRATHSDRGLAPDGGTLFKKVLVEVGQSPILINGIQSQKLGRKVTKGRHKGLPMRYITLEEGRTCPTSCLLKSKCYGGNMPLAKRIIWRGAHTGIIIADAIASAPSAMIRLHNLGDFPSLHYAQAVRAALRVSGSAAFGFTHWQPETEIGSALRNWWNPKFCIRTSYLHGSRAPIPEKSAVIVSHPDQAKQHNAIVCPEQMGRAKSCADCGYCWHTTRPVAFVLHEKLARLNQMKVAA